MKHFTTALRMACAATNEAEGDDFQLVKEVVERSGDTRRCGVPPRQMERCVIEYHWGKDLSGTIGGAGGVGGLLYLSISNSSTLNSSTRQLYVPWYDAYGNIMGYWDAQGNVVAEYTYDAFGKLIASSGPMVDVFSLRYSTKYFDPETEFYYYGYRFYSPELKRWITRDPIGEEGGVNLYAMCENNAICIIDPFGHRRMITGVFVPNNKIRSTSTGREEYLARDVLVLCDKMNSQCKNKKGGPQFNVKVKDLVLTPIEVVRNEIDANSANVFIFAHGYLKINGRLYGKTAYVWNKKDIVEEGISTGKTRGRLIPLASFGPNLNMHNVYACYIREDVRKFKISDGRIASEVIHNVDSSFTMLLERLRKYIRAKRTNCTIDISIYEGDWDDFDGSTEDGLQNWGLSTKGVQ